MAEGTRARGTGDWSYVDENNGIDVELGGEIVGMKGIWGGGGNSQNRKMFSHREHGFPTGEGCRR